MSPYISEQVSTSIASSSTAFPKTKSYSAQQDIDIIYERRLNSIVGALPDPAGSISAWLSSLGPDGKWPNSEVDYTTGCAARRANWPAQEHWQRILVMAAAWHGGLSGANQYVKDTTIRAAISRAMDYWFSRDFTNLACLASGGTVSCPCTNLNNSLWNTNWFSNIILIPDLVGQSCVLLNGTLTPAEVVSCASTLVRSYDTFDTNIPGVGFLTGANTLDVASIGIDFSLLTVNLTVLTDAYRRVHLELAVENSVKADGIRPDGAFGQHGGILYNGNYGKDYINDILGFEIEAGGTQFAANATAQAALETLLDGDRWMIYGNSLKGTLHWDFSVLGRFISFPVIDAQATGSLNLNLTQVLELGQIWSSDSLVTFAGSLSQTVTNANAGSLKGNRMFFTNDYMVHRGPNYVTTVKMYSSRTQNTECTNSQNPFGFHLSDGTVYTYLRGDEYEDIAAAWDWNLIPGTTVDYGATILSCDHTQFTGIENFVGGVSDGERGIAVMRYTNPVTKSLKWQKVWFFLDDDVQHVMIANITSTTSAPVYSVLDQRLHTTSVVQEELVVDGTRSQTLWHGRMGYILPQTDFVNITIEAGQKTGNWSTIGTSTQPAAIVDLFAAWINHSSLSTPIAYTIYPDTDVATFSKKSKKLRLRTVQNDAHVSAIYDEVHKLCMIIFWDVDGGSTTITPPSQRSITISTNGNSALIYKFDSGELVISDPSQTLSYIEVIISSQQIKKTASIAMPQGGLAGSSITQIV
ncbi:Chondroitinase-AC [Termitomyces sp. T112]|nr:Chondroitinase-AC [Termitomyces sp. T112]